MDPPDQTLLSDRWQLVEFIGEGAMGEVWRGRHVVLGHEVAIKLMRTGAASDYELTVRFLREARIAAQLRHKNLARVEDYGTTVDGRPYLVMELLRGQTLGKVLAQGRKPDWQTVALVAHHVGSACDVAHAARIVHRDLKPDNFVVVTDDDGQMLVKVLDFGVAKVTDSLLVTAGGIVTASHAVLGTPMYMSPEQAQGCPDLDGCSDLWSLAVIVYQMLTGRLPYTATTVAQLLYAVLTADIPPPSSIEPTLGASVDRWFTRALNRDRDQRFQSGREFATTLCAALGLAPWSQSSLPPLRAGSNDARVFTPPPPPVPSVLPAGRDARFSAVVEMPAVVPGPETGLAVLSEAQIPSTVAFVAHDHVAHHDANVRAQRGGPGGYTIVAALPRTQAMSAAELASVALAPGASQPPRSPALPATMASLADAHALGVIVPRSSLWLVLAGIIAGVILVFGVVAVSYTRARGRSQFAKNPPAAALVPSRN